jgi:hypothetical protein
VSQYWESVAARSNGQHTADELAMAAYRLVTEQVLYYADRQSRMAYYAIERFEREMKVALTPVGVDVKVNRQLRYAYGLPLHEKVGTASIAQTLFALVLRFIYDERARIGDLTDNGEVVCGLVELEEKYRLLTGRPMPVKGDLDALMQTTKRWGIARKASDDDSNVAGSELDGQPFVVMIRPGIVEVLGEAALQRLAQWPKPEANPVDEKEIDSTTENSDMEAA